MSFINYIQTQFLEEAEEYFKTANAFQFLITYYIELSHFVHVLWSILKRGKLRTLEKMVDSKT